MKMRNLGNSGLSVGALAFGGNVFGWTVDEALSFKLLDAFVDAGFNMVDTADVYTRWIPGHVGGESETIIGRWFKESGKRSKVVLATKCGMEMGPGLKGLAKNYIISEVEESLKRLQTDYIDLYQSHVDDPSTPLEETMEAFVTLIKQGKVRAVGASNYSAPRLEAALQASAKLGVPHYTSLQPLYNLYDRSDYEAALEKVCVDHNIGVITYFSLAAGFLSGKYRSEADLAKSARGRGVKKYLNDRGFRIMDALEAVAKQKQSTPAKVALAWVIARPSVTAPIASATSIEQLNDLIAATTLDLDSASIAALNQASAI